MPTDTLTNLPDRAEFLAELARFLNDVSDHERFTGLVIADVRHLQQYNIELGYSQADSVLRMLAARMRECLRQSDSMSRIGNSEFALILPGLKSHAQPRMAVSKIQRAFAEPLNIDGKDVRVHLSFGVSVGPIDATHPEDFLRCADAALLHAKSTGRDCVHYAECPDHAQPPMLALERELEEAVSSGEFEGYYQPVVDLDTGSVVGVEMLSRWTSPAHGSVRRDIFTEIAERSGLILPLTLTALNTGLRECREWQSMLPNTSIAIDLSPKLLAEPDLPELIARAASLWDIRPWQLVLEITENAMMSDPQRSLEILKQLHDRSIGIAIDDFGTGYSSLAYLKDLPIDKLKIDRSFVTNMVENEPDKRIVQAVIDLAHNFDLNVMADGIENEETLDTLTLMGCQFAQGNHVGPPMAMEDLLRWSDETPFELNE